VIALSHLAEFLRTHALAFPTLAKFAIAMAIIVCVPRLSLGTNRPIADFFADLGKRLRRSNVYCS